MRCAVIGQVLARCEAEDDEVGAVGTQDPLDRGPLLIGLNFRSLGEKVEEVKAFVVILDGWPEGFWGVGI